MGGYDNVGWPNPELMLIELHNSTGIIERESIVLDRCGFVINGYIFYM